MSDASRFSQKWVPSKRTGCWVWTAYCDRSGYGKFFFLGKMMLAHRVAWMMWRTGDPIGDLNVCHKCDNPPCVNPAHLFLGTQEENLHDARDKGRIRKGLDHPNVKLDSETVRSIRSRILSGHVSADIARELGISQQTICDIHKGRTWRHVR